MRLPATQSHRPPTFTSFVADSCLCRDPAAGLPAAVAPILQSAQHAPPLRGPSRAASLLLSVAHCSAAAGAGGPAAPDAAAPVQWGLMRIAGDGRCLFRALSIGADLLESQGGLLTPCCCGGGQQG